MKPLQFEVQDPLLAGRIARCRNLPSPPGVATRIIELAKDSAAASTTDISRIVEMDPALSAKILRLANSPLYGMRRAVDSIGQAIAVLGVNETMSLALSFSLVKGLQASGTAGLDYRHYWRRSLACATGARNLAKTLKLPDADRYFLAGLMQDIGMLVVDCVFPSVYQRADARRANHHGLSQIEQNELGVDHARIGAALLRRWGFPDHVLYATYCSHGTDSCDAPASYQSLVRGVYLASLLAEIWWHADWDMQVSHAAAEAQRLFQIQPDEFALLLSSCVSVLHEASAIFEINVGDPAVLDKLVAEAAELLRGRTSSSLQQVVDLRGMADGLAQQTRQLEGLISRDKHTGLFSRAHFDRRIDDEYTRATATGAPLSVAYVRLNITMAPGCADERPMANDVLRKLGQLAEKVYPNNPIIARYVGGDIVILLANTTGQTAQQRCDVLLEAIRRDPIGAFSGVELGISIGIATVTPAKPFDSARALLLAADAAADQARDNGPSNVVAFEPRHATPRHIGTAVK